MSRKGRPNKNHSGVYSVCGTCGKAVYTPRARAKNGRGKYCSKACKNQAQVGKEAWNKGKPGSPEATAKRRKTMLERYGKVTIGTTYLVSAAQKARMSEAAKRRWVRDRSAILEHLRKGKLKQSWRDSHSKRTTEWLKKTWATPEGREKMLKAHARGKKKATRIELLAQHSLNTRAILFFANTTIEAICTPDLVLPEPKIAIFCDGCFWHACPTCGFNHPRSRVIFGLDKKFTAMLREKGWTVLRFWEHEFKKNPDVVGEALDAFAKGQTLLTSNSFSY